MKTLLKVGVLIVVLLLAASLLGGIAESMLAADKRSMLEAGQTAGDAFGGFKALTLFFAGWLGGIYAGGMAAFQVLVGIIVLMVCGLAHVDPAYGRYIAVLSAIGVGFTVVMTPLGYALFVVEVLAVLFYLVANLFARYGYTFNTGSIDVEGRRGGKLSARQTKISQDPGLDMMQPIASKLPQVILALDGEEDDLPELPELPHDADIVIW